MPNYAQASKINLFIHYHIIGSTLLGISLTNLHKIAASGVYSSSTIHDSSDESDQECAQSSSSSTLSSANMLLNCLRCPAASSLAHKRKISHNPIGGKKRSDRPTYTLRIMRSVSPADRVDQYPGECLCVGQNNTLFCNACRQELSLKKSVISKHIQSGRHTAGKGRVLINEKFERTVAQSLESYNKDMHPVGETLSEAVKVYRVKTVMTFMRAGVPLSKIDSFRDILEEHAFSLSSSQHLRELIPLILQQERGRRLKGDMYRSSLMALPIQLKLSY